MLPQAAAVSINIREFNDKNREKQRKRQGEGERGVDF